MFRLLGFYSNFLCKRYVNEFSDFRKIIKSSYLRAQKELWELPLHRYIRNGLLMCLKVFLGVHFFKNVVISAVCKLKTVWKMQKSRYPILEHSIYWTIRTFCESRTQHRKRVFDTVHTVSESLSHTHCFSKAQRTVSQWSMGEEWFG